jgi:hypothetical protein
VTGGGIDFEGGGGAGLGCVSCGQPLVAEYWEANGKVACTPCKQRIDQVGTAGTPASRFLMASALGTGAMAIGTLVWWAVARYTGFEAAIIAIGIGWLVGTAVRIGAQARGGWLYQAMAVTQTYLAVVLAYVFLAHGQMEQAQKDELGVLLWPVLFVFSLVAPFAGGWGAILSVIIIGVGLLQAWQKNRPLSIAWSGPHRIAPGPAAPPPLPEQGASPGPPPLPPHDGG